MNIFEIKFKKFSRFHRTYKIWPPSAFFYYPQMTCNCELLHSLKNKHSKTVAHTVFYRISSTSNILPLICRLNFHLFFQINFWCYIFWWVYPNSCLFSNHSRKDALMSSSSHCLYYVVTHLNDYFVFLDGMWVAWE